MGERKKFIFRGNTLEITEERAEYNRIRLKFEQLAEDAVEEFTQLYKKNNHSLDDVSKFALNQGNQIIGRVITKTVEEFVSLGFYNIDEEQFIEKYYNRYYIFEEYYNKINDIYMDIVLTEEQKDEYRRLRKESRGRWQGGGFGFEGAIKGATKAGMLNMASGAMHGVVNMGGKIISNISASNKKSKVFKDPSTINTLVEGVYWSVLDMHLAYILFMTENCSLNVKGVTENDIKEAKVIFNNIQSKNIDEKLKKELIIKILNLNPYYDEIYMFIIETYGDRGLEIEKIANYFGINVKGYKEELIDELFEELSLNTEKEALEARETIIKKLNEFGLSKNNKYIKDIDIKIADFDEQARTVNGIVFNNRQEANLALKEKEIVEKIFETVNINNENEVQDAYNKIKGMIFKTEIPNPYILELEKRIDEINLQKRTVDGFEFESIEVADEARREIKQIEEIFEGLKDDRESLIQAKNQIEKLKFNTDIGYKYIDRINNLINSLDANDRVCASELQKNKEDVKNSIICLIIIMAAGGYFFGRVGTIIKVIIGIFILGGILEVKDSLKKVKESKKAVRRIRKLRN